MQMQLAVVAEYVNRSDMGNVNLMGVFDHIASHAYPAHHHSLTVFFRMRVTPSEADGPPLKVAIKLMDADGGLLVEMRGETVLNKPSADWGWWDHQLTLNNLLFEKPGTYSFALLVNGMEQATVPLRMVLVSPPMVDESGTLGVGDE